MKKDNMIKDAIILCLITLILGGVLAGVYAVTKDTIDQQQTQANNEACAAVVAQGDTVQDAESAKLDAALAYLKTHDLSNTDGVAEEDSLIKHVEISEVHPTANGGTVYLATAKKGYGGDIGFALGVALSEDGVTPVITGISITSQAETAGLGANCENEEWQGSFTGKKMPENASDNMYNKQGATDTQVQALSGATVTSRAITNAVKGILFVASSEGGAENE